MGIRGFFVSKWCALAFVFLIVTLIETIAARDDWGVTKFDVRRVKYTWHIENYSHHNKEYGEDIKSEIFSGNDSKAYRWQMQLYPRGHTLQSRLGASLYLILITKQAIAAEVQFAIIHKNGKPVNIKSFKKRYPGEAWGFPVFINHVSLEKGLKAVYLPNDVLSMSVDIAFNAGLIRASKQCKNINTEKCTSLPITSTFMSDLDLFVEGVQIKVHRAALTAHSKWIENELTYHPNAIVVVLPTGVNLDVLKEALQFIYKGTTDADEEMLKKLLALSDRLDMKNLKLYCEQALCKAMTTRSASEILEFAKKNNAKNLKREAQNYLIAIEAGIARI